MRLVCSEAVVGQEDGVCHLPTLESLSNDCTHLCERCRPKLPEQRVSLSLNGGYSLQHAMQKVDITVCISSTGLAQAQTLLVAVSLSRAQAAD